MKELNVKEELKSLIPPLETNVYSGLEKNILNDGCRDALVVWGNTIIDGHNRYEICQKHGIEFSIAEKEFDDINAAKVWIIDNQKDRRNLSDGWKYELAQKRKELLLEKGKEKKVKAGKEHGKGQKVLSTIDKSYEHDTRKEMASKLGWSTGKVAQADIIWKNADEEIKDKVKTGDISINQAYQKVKREENKNKAIEKMQNASLEAGEKKYRIIYADPPWKYREEQHAEFGGVHEKPLGAHYPSMSIAELCELPVPEMIEENAVLFLWATSPLLEECFDVIRAWGFKYKTSMVWDKVKHNVGNYVSVRHEFLLICTKGSCTPDVKKLHDSVQSIERGKHSEKPEIFREIIDEIYPNGNRIELFARKKIDNWETWGNEL